MYYKHFKLSGPPFQFTPSAGVLYPGKSHQEALAVGVFPRAQRSHAARRRPGTGKTTLISW